MGDVFIAGRRTCFRPVEHMFLVLFGENVKVMSTTGKAGKEATSGQGEIHASRTQGSR